MCLVFSFSFWRCVLLVQTQKKSNRLEAVADQITLLVLYHKSNNGSNYLAIACIHVYLYVTLTSPFNYNFPLIFKKVRHIYNFLKKCNKNRVQMQDIYIYIIHIYYIYIHIYLFWLSTKLFFCHIFLSTKPIFIFSWDFFQVLKETFLAFKTKYTVFSKKKKKNTRWTDYSLFYIWWAQSLPPHIGIRRFWVLKLKCPPQSL